FDSVSRLTEHVLHTNCWIDTGTFGAFLKSLDCSVAVVVIGQELKKPLSVPDELTNNKEFYICLWLEDDHYQTDSAGAQKRRLGLVCLTRLHPEFHDRLLPQHLTKY
ncbi:unnamed protein product, partial [Ectocarpus sp. 4 AP-2014]